MLTNDDLKKYSIIVDGGSGCLFQPMTELYTYIITAKHLFYEEVKNLMPKQFVLKPNGTEITITQNVLNGDNWEEVAINFILMKDENYFEHNDADIAILKIQPFLDGFNQITVQNKFENENNFFQCGFPANQRYPNTEKYRQIKIELFGASGNFIHQAQLFGGFQQNNIEGMSGCGILKLNNEGISIIGIQSKMASSLLPTGAIDFVPIKFAKEIIDYPQNFEKLRKLVPNTLAHFSFLKDKAFELNVDEFHLEQAKDIRITLQNKAQSIIESDITPIGIKELFSTRLLMSEKDEECLSFNSLWVAWLEFLTIMNLMKYEPISSSDLSIIFNSYRLKFVNADDWTEKNLREEYGKSDYLGMPLDATVVISSTKPALTSFIIPKGKLINITRPYDKSKFKADIGVDPFTSFDFVHIDYFKTKCITQKIEVFANLNEEEIINKIKEEYNELFT